jgi:hypothetical protein
MIISASVKTPEQAVQSASTWQTATVDLISWMVEHDRCFSSGEIAAYLRTFRPDLQFRVSGIGDFIRDRYHNGLFPMYVDQQSGASLYPTQVARTTTGTATTIDGRTVASRTRVGQVVFVYARDAADGFAHDFEIFIPDVGDPLAKTAPPAPPAPAVPPPVVSAGVLITGALARDDLEARVANDRRLYVPRAAFEAYVALSGLPLRGGPNGDPVYVRLSGDEVLISRTPWKEDHTVYHLWNTRGRVAIDGATIGHSPFNPGDTFEIRVDSDHLTVDLAKPL